MVEEAGAILSARSFASRGDIGARCGAKIQVASEATRFPPADFGDNHLASRIERPRRNGRPTEHPVADS